MSPAATTSKVHAAGFIAVSRRFHWLARVLGGSASPASWTPGIADYDAKAL
jgi:hypothetical protein